MTEPLRFTHALYLTWKVGMNPVRICVYVTTSRLEAFRCYFRFLKPDWQGWTVCTRKQGYEVKPRMQMEREPEYVEPLTDDRQPEGLPPETRPELGVLFIGKFPGRESPLEYDDGGLG